MKRITKSSKSTRAKSSKAPKEEETETQEDSKAVESKLNLLDQFKLQSKRKLPKASSKSKTVKEEKLVDDDLDDCENVLNVKVKRELLDDDDDDVPKKEISVDDGIKEGNDEIRGSSKLKVFEGSCSKSKSGIKREQIKVEYDSIPPVKIIKEEDYKVKFDGNFPLHWEEILDNLREMRKNHDAPVDSMGCDQCMDDKSNAKDQRYQALLSLMLSSQTKDQVTHAAMQRLIEHGCSVNNILETTNEKLEELIRPVGFYRRKVQYIKESSRMIVDKFNGDIPKTLEELCTLKGVGPKMAHLCMKTAWGEVTGIGVDTHVHRISNRMGWVNSKTPEETRKQLENWLPKEIWSEVNHLLVGFGQQICKPVNPQCATCLNYKLCPYGIKNLKLK